VIRFWGPPRSTACFNAFPVACAAVRTGPERAQRGSGIARPSGRPGELRRGRCHAERQDFAVFSEGWLMGLLGRATPDSP